MLYGLYMSTAGANYQNRRLEVVANNIANVDTTGFRRQFPILQARKDHGSEFGEGPPVEPGSERRMGGGVVLGATPTDFETMGTMKVTSSDYNFAINGPGFFQVESNGQRFLTRDGAFTLDQEGFLVTNDGQERVLGAGGAPIRLDGTLPFRVMPDGAIFQVNNAGQNLPAGRLGLVQPVDPENQLTPVGGNRYRFDGPTTPPTGSIQQRMLEGSNVNAVEEMTEMVEVNRIFEMNINMIQLQNDTLRTLIESVPRLQ